MASNKALRNHYASAFSLVGSLINEWDPYNLLAEGAPPDEFEAEVVRLVPRLLRAQSPDEAAVAISEVFAASFSAMDFTADSCREVGERIYAQLKSGGYVK